MKFKVGDRVRFTREAIKKHLENDWEMKDDLLFGAVVVESDDTTTIVKNKLKHINNTNNFELVPEEPEFEYGEEIEVSDDGEEWEKRIYLATVGVERKLHICVSRASIERYKSGLVYNAYTWEYARKLRPQLTRKEIAEKFGVSEDFTLVD